MCLSSHGDAALQTTQQESGHPHPRGCQEPSGEEGCPIRTAFRAQPRTRPSPRSTAEQVSISTYHSQRLRHTAQRRPAMPSTSRAVPAHVAPMEEAEQAEGGPGKHQVTRNLCPNPQASRLWAHRLVGLGMALQSVTRGAPGPWDGVPAFARPGARDRGE